MAVSGPRRELIELLMADQTAPDAADAGILADWLEEFGEPDDEPARLLAAWFRDTGSPWNSRVYFRPQLLDLNWIAGSSNCIVRMPVFATSWALIGYQVPITGWRRYRILPPPSLFVTTASGVAGPLAPLVSATVAIMTLTSLGVPEIPDVDFRRAMAPPPRSRWKETTTVVRP